MLAFFRQSAQGVQHITLRCFLSFVDALTLDCLGNHAARGNAATAAIGHEGGSDDGIIVDLEPYLHCVTAGACHSCECVSALHNTHVPWGHGMVDYCFRVDRAGIRQNQLLEFLKVSRHSFASCSSAISRHHLDQSFAQPGHDFIVIAFDFALIAEFG